MKITLTKTQIHVAKKLGLSLEWYAKTLAELYESEGRKYTKRQRLLAWYWKKKGKR
jgi:hypothetical protein